MKRTGTYTVYGCHERDFDEEIRNALIDIEGAGSEVVDIKFAFATVGEEVGGELDVSYAALIVYRWDDDA